MRKRAEGLERAYELAEQIERVLASGEAGQEPTWSSVALGHPGGEIVAAVVAILRKMGRDAELGGDGIDSIKVRQ